MDDSYRKLTSYLNHLKSKVLGSSPKNRLKKSFAVIQNKFENGKLTKRDVISGLNKVIANIFKKIYNLK